MIKKGLCLIVASILTLSVFTACGKPAEGGAATVQSLRFVDVSPSPARQKYYEDVFAKFTTETGIKVVYESVPWDDAANRLSVQGAAHQLPDVMTIWPGWVGQFAPAGWIVPINKYLEPSKDTFTAAAQLLMNNEVSIYGDNYTVPDGLMVKGIFVRKDWCEAAGITLKDSWTYDEYFDTVAKLTDSTQNHYGISFRGARGAFDALLSMYIQGFKGGNLYKEDGTILVNDQQSIDAYKKWCDLYLKGYAPKDSINWGFVEMVDNFTGGLTGTLINDSEVTATLLEKMKPEQWTVMPMPTADDGKIYNTFGAPYSYGISGDCKNPDAAWQLIEFLVRPENSIEYCKMGGLIPIKKDVADDPLFGKDGPYATFVSQLNNPNIALPAVIGPFDFTDLHQGMFHEEMQKYLLGKQTAEEALLKVTTELEKRMKAYLVEHPDFKVDMSKTLTK